MEVNDLVMFNENGQDYVATVLEVREVDHHMGNGGEPVLHIGFFKPVMKPNAQGKLTLTKVIGTHQQSELVQFRLDVVHESHKFDEKANKAGFKGSYPGGRWRRLEVKNAEVKDTEKKSKKSVN